jgi:hypothetical protein
MEVVNYRTLEVVLPWEITGSGKAVVNITAYRDGKFLDYKVYNLTEMLAGTKRYKGGSHVAAELRQGRRQCLRYSEERGRRLGM